MRRLLILSGVRWNFAWQRHHSLASAAACNGWRVTFVEPAPRSVVQVARFVREKRRPGHPKVSSRVEQINPVPDNIEVVNFLQFLRSNSGYLIGSRNGRPYDVVISYVPTWLSLFQSLGLANRRIYDCVVDWRAAPKEWFPPRSARLVERLIAALAQRHCYGVTTDSAATARRFERWRASAIELPPAVDDVFRDFRWSAGHADRYGYFGSLRSSEVDVDFIDKLARLGHAVDVVGPVDSRASEILASSPVRVLPPQALPDLVTIVDEWSVILLPYKETRRSASLVPAKLWNALSTRKTVLYSGISMPPDLSQYVLDTESHSMSAVRIDDTVSLPGWLQTLNRMLEVAYEEH